MIVYGDHPIPVRLRAFVALMRRRIDGSRPDLEEARARLIFAGQLEQAAEDGALACASECRTLTAAAAQDFVRLWSGGARSSDVAQRMRQQLDAIECRARDIDTLQIRTPEGFAWYALSPDAYAQATEKWVGDAPRGTRVLVIGVRSIGTTLAATVVAVLKQRKLQADYYTVRPRGHPFDRQVDLPVDPPIADHILTVDEGPGLSGTSMASVAAALIARGFERCALTFFPGHLHGPGSEANSSVRSLWAEITCCCCSWEERPLRGRSVPDVLRSPAQRSVDDMLGKPLTDIGAGKWRELAEGLADRGRAIAPFLEQPKLLARGRKGDVLLKFAGTALAHPCDVGDLRSRADAQATKLSELADRRWTIAPLGRLDGWIALPWIEGRRLNRSDMNFQRLTTLGAYINDTAGPPLAASESQSAYDRLRDVLVANVRALLDPTTAQRAEWISDKLANGLARLDLPSYGDGRLAPHEWVQGACPEDGCGRPSA